jgi:PAS domain S-box-containing protein
MFSSIPRNRALIITGLVIGNLFIAVLAGYFLYQSRQHYEQRAEISTQNIAQAIDQSLSNSIEKVDLALCAVADELERQLASGGIKAGEINTVLATYEKRIYDVEGIRVTNTAGAVIYGKGVEKSAPASYAGRDFFPYLRDHADAGLQVTKPIIGRVSQKWIIAFARRYKYPDGTFGGVITAAISLDHFNALLSRYDIGPHGGITLRDADLSQIARYPKSSAGQSSAVGNTVVSPKLRELVLSGVSQATYRTITPIDKTERILTFHRLRIAPMIATVGLAREDYLTEWDSEVLKTCLLVGSFALLSLVSAVIQLRFLKQGSRESARNELYLKNASDGIHILDESGTVVEASDSFCRMLGYERDEVIGMNVTQWDARWPANTLVEERLPELIRNEKTEVFETLHRRKNGDILEVEVNVVGIDMEGKRYLYASSRDITERRQAEENAREKEKRYRILFESANDGIFLQDATGFLDCNQRGAAMYGLPKEKIIGRSPADFCPERQPGGRLSSEVAAEKIHAAMGGEPQVFEWQPLRSDGVPFDVEITLNRLELGGSVCLQAIVRDITERKRAEQAEREHQELFSKFFQNDLVMMTLSDIASGRYIEVNDCFTQNSGFSRDEVIGRTSLEIGWLTEQDREFILNRMQNEGRVSGMEFRVRRKNGESFWCSYSGEVVTVSGQKVLFSIAEDITSRMELQSERNKSQRLESLGLLAGGIAHDFNNILTGILGNVSFARMLVGDDHKATERLAACEKAAKRASDLTRQLLTFARGGEPVKKTVDTKQLVEESLSFALRGATAKGIVECQADTWPMDADSGQMSQVFNNLLINARQAMPDSGTVTITINNHEIHGGDPLPVEPGRYVRIVVRDQGAGIPAEHLTKIFDPYFTTKDQGSGLGLASVYSIVKRHGGMVTVTSAPGKGSAFTLLVPAASETTGKFKEEHLEISSMQGEGRILVMDDEEVIRDLATAMLKELGYAAESCKDGREAVNLHAAALDEGKPYAAIILDLTVPGGMGGREAAALIRARDPEVPLIVSSGYSNDAVVSEYSEYGFSGVVVKPYSMEGITGELVRVLQERHVT